MSFYLFLLVTATLFVRPAEIVTDLQDLPVYEWLIVACLAASAFKVLPLLTKDALVRQPITLAVLGMVAAVFLSHASHGDLWSARHDALEFSKVVVYYLLLLANVNSSERLRLYLLCLLGCIMVVAALALLQYHGAINIESLATLEYYDIDATTGHEELVRRLQSTGIFHDPNDLSMIVVVGMAISAYFIFDPRLVQLKAPLAACMGCFFYALLLTKSRGGFLALLAALGALFQARYGWKKSLVLLAGTLPLILLLVTGRQADIGGAMSEGTGQSRVQLWSAGLGMLRTYPLFGVGFNHYAEEAGQVAHNSYIHAFGELGLFGGTIFLGAWCYAARALYQIGQEDRRFEDLELGRLRPYLLSATSGYAASILTLTRTEVVPTYLVLGLASSYMGMACTDPPLAAGEFGPKLVKQAVAVSLLFVAAAYVFVRVFAHWDG